MVPRTDLVWVESTKTVPQALALALRSGFSRIPVIGENVDDIVGVTYLKDLARRAQDAERARVTTVEEVMRSAAFVPESKPVDELLREMQAHRSHIAIVIDEYGGTAGLITIEDILEEIVGEITDEYDNEHPPIVRIDERTGRVPIAGSHAVLHGLSLVAEDVGVRRNRVDTILATRVHPPDDDRVAERD